MKNHKGEKSKSFPETLSFCKKSEKTAFWKNKLFFGAMKKKKFFGLWKKKVCTFLAAVFFIIFYHFLQGIYHFSFTSYFQDRIKILHFFYSRKNHQEEKKRRKFRRKLLHILSQNAKSFASNFKKVFGLKKTKNPCTLKKKSWYFDRRRYWKKKAPDGIGFSKYKTTIRLWKSYTIRRYGVFIFHQFRNFRQQKKKIQKFWKKKCNFSP